MTSRLPILLTLAEIDYLHFLTSKGHTPRMDAVHASLSTQVAFYHQVEKDAEGKAYHVTAKGSDGTLEVTYDE